MGRVRQPGEGRASRLRARLPRRSAASTSGRPARGESYAQVHWAFGRGVVRDAHDRAASPAPARRRCPSPTTTSTTTRATSASRAASRTCRRPHTLALMRGPAGNRRRRLARQGDLLHQHLEAAGRRAALPAAAPGRADGRPVPRARASPRRRTRSDGSTTRFEGTDARPSTCASRRCPRSRRWSAASRSSRRTGSNSKARSSRA